MHIIAILSDNMRKRRKICITDITHMEDGPLPGDLRWGWATL
jgi:hypothetical protein